jgi:hypothetical protein
MPFVIVSWYNINKCKILFNADLDSGSYFFTLPPCNPNMGYTLDRRPRLHFLGLNFFIAPFASRTNVLLEGLLQSD